MTSKEVVYSLIKSRRWTSGSDIEATAGDGALRRLRELRSEYDIKGRRIEGSNAYEYRLVGRV